MGNISFPGYDIIAKLEVFRDVRKREIWIDFFGIWKEAWPLLFHCICSSNCALWKVNEKLRKRFDCSDDSVVTQYIEMLSHWPRTSRNKFHDW